MMALQLMKMELNGGKDPDDGTWYYRTPDMDDWNLLRNEFLCPRKIALHYFLVLVIISSTSYWTPENELREFVNFTPL